MPFSAGQRVTAAQLNALIPQTFDVVCTAATTVTTTLADVTGASITFSTVNANATALVIWTCDVNITVLSGGNTIVASMNYDGSDVTAREMIVTMDDVHRWTLTQTDIVNLGSAGSHTIKLRSQKTVAAGTAQFIQDHTGFRVVVFDTP